MSFVTNVASFVRRFVSRKSLASDSELANMFLKPQGLCRSQQGHVVFTHLID